MAVRGRRGADGLLVVALAKGDTVELAACAAGISVRTAYRRLADPAFRIEVHRARATLVEQALGNVVHNAIRHNRAGGHAAVTLDADGGAFVVRVRDDGPGVDDDELGKLTDRAWRSTGARTRSPDGLGLGLTITRRVCDRHGWSLGLRRVDGGGLEAEIRGPTSAPRSDR